MFETILTKFCRKVVSDKESCIFDVQAYDPYFDLFYKNNNSDIVFSWEVVVKKHFEVDKSLPSHYSNFLTGDIGKFPQTPSFPLPTNLYLYFVFIENYLILFISDNQNLTFLDVADLFSFYTASKNDVNAIDMSKFCSFLDFMSNKFRPLKWRSEKNLIFYHLWQSNEFSNSYIIEPKLKKSIAILEYYKSVDFNVFYSINTIIKNKALVLILTVEIDNLFDKIDSLAMPSEKSLLKNKFNDCLVAV